MSTYCRAICGGVADSDLDHPANFHHCSWQAYIQRRAVFRERIHPVGEGAGLLLSSPRDLTVYGVNKERRVGVQDQGLDPWLEQEQVENQPTAHLLYSKVQPEVQMKVPQLEIAEV